MESWSAPDGTVWRTVDAQGLVQIVRHPARPFTARVATEGLDLRLIAQTYLDAASALLPAGDQGVIADLRVSLAGVAPAGWSWQALDDRGRGSREVPSSHGSSTISASTMLLAIRGAAVPAEASPQTSSLRSIRVVVHRRGDGDHTLLRITGMSLHRHAADDRETRMEPAPAVAGRAVPTRRTEAAAHAAARVMRREPASRVALKTGGSLELEPNETNLERLDETLSVGELPLAGPAGEMQGRYFRVLAAGPGPGYEERSQIDSLGSGVRLIDPSTWSATAFRQAQDWFDLFERTGLDAQEMLPFVVWPLDIRYVALVDGRRANAQVRWQMANGMASHPIDAPQRMEVRFALAPQAPFSICCDSRWQWHEFGHVVLGGATGQLELPFCHGVGDALSSLMHDPDSLLRRDPVRRGLSFPWICTDTEQPHDGVYARRHDRMPAERWAWRGTVSFGTRDDAGWPYRMEELLSSTLFTLYRSSGGDDGGDGLDDNSIARRRLAADHVAYLILRAASLLGPAERCPAETPDHFVSALIDADVGTSSFGFAGTTKPVRSGGTLHKLIRWAFEAHGLYARSPDGFSPVNGPGQPPPVDLYLRRSAEPLRRDGGYGPIDLAAGQWRSEARLLGLTRSAGHLAARVHLANRGTRPSSLPTLRAWVIALSAIDEVPSWPNKRWLEIAPVVADTVAAVSPGAPPVVCACEWTLPGDLETWAIGVLLSVSCDEDPANVERSTGLPCAEREQQIDLLVASDNNLAYCALTAVGA